MNENILSHFSTVLASWLIFKN